MCKYLWLRKTPYFQLWAQTILIFKCTAGFISTGVGPWESYGWYLRAATFTNTKWTNPYIFMLAIPDPWNLSQRLRDKGLKIILLHNGCRELLSTVINCWCIHLRQEEQQKENISLNLELYLFMYALWCYSTIIIWHIGSRLVLH